MMETLQPTKYFLERSNTETDAHLTKREEKSGKTMIWGLKFKAAASIIC